MVTRTVSIHPASGPQEPVVTIKCDIGAPYEQADIDEASCRLV
jgi:hypothetical protein